MSEKESKTAGRERAERIASAELAKKTQQAKDKKREDVNARVKARAEAKSAAHAEEISKLTEKRAQPSAKKLGAILDRIAARNPERAARLKADHTEGLVKLK